ncbi:MAG: HDOD domain-containing protein [Spirochaeta sp.]|nr:HDOD domain-containing protein [Spirochaeta sp.]
MKLNRAQIKRVTNSSIPLTIKTYTLSHDTEVYLEEILEAFLTELGYTEIKDQLAYCLRELAVNAKKANTKRAYFLEKDLNLEDPDEYDEGMKTFKEETLENIQYYLQKQKEQGLYIKIIFHTQGKTFNITVRNNVEITRKEQIRVFDRIARSRAFTSMEEAFATVLDNSEGAGLGIVILILMLKKMGLEEDSFSIDMEEGETIAALSIPFSDIQLEKTDLLTQAILREVESLPQFPDNIINLQKLIADPDSEIADIARQISTDPMLTADLLKLVNSAQFMLPKKVDNIVEAVKLVGMKGVRNLLYTHGTQKILNEKYQDMRSLWDHSYRTAFYAYHLARSFIKKKDILDDIYVGGILHDLGKIIIATLHPELLDRIISFCAEKEIPTRMLEDLSVGFNHAEIGAMIAEKWNFPEQLVAAIRHHHEPNETDENFADVVYTVYLANALTALEREQITFEQIDKNVLNDFGIQTTDHLTKIQERLDKAFLQQRSHF